MVEAGASSEEYVSSHEGSSNDSLMSDVRIAEEYQEETMVSSRSSDDLMGVDQVVEDLTGVAHQGVADADQIVPRLDGLGNTTGEVAGDLWMKDDVGETTVVTHRVALEQMVETSDIMSPSGESADIIWRAGLPDAYGAPPSTAIPIMTRMSCQQKMAKFSSTAVDLWYNTTNIEHLEERHMNVSFIHQGKSNQFSCSPDKHAESVMASTDTDALMTHAAIIDHRPERDTQTDKPSCKLKQSPIDLWNSASSITSYHHHPSRQQSSEPSSESSLHPSHQLIVTSSSQQELTAPQISVTFRQGDHIENMEMDSVYDSLSVDETFPEPASLGEDRLDAAKSETLAEERDPQEQQETSMLTGLDNMDTILAKNLEIPDGIASSIDVKTHIMPVSIDVSHDLPLLSIPNDEHSPHGSHMSVDSLDSRKGHLQTAISGPGHIMTSSGQNIMMGSGYDSQSRMSISGHSIETDSLDGNMADSMETDELPSDATSLIHDNTPSMTSTVTDGAFSDSTVTTGESTISLLDSVKIYPESFTSDKEQFRDGYISRPDVSIEDAKGDISQTHASSSADHVMSQALEDKQTSGLGSDPGLVLHHATHLSIDTSSAAPLIQKLPGREKDSDLMEVINSPIVDRSDKSYLKVTSTEQDSGIRQSNERFSSRHTDSR